MFDRIVEAVELIEKYREHEPVIYWSNYENRWTVEFDLDHSISVKDPYIEQAIRQAVAQLKDKIDA